MQVGGNEYDLDKLVYVNQVLGSIDKGKEALAELKKLQSKSNRLKNGEAMICVIEALSPDGEEMKFFHFPDFPDAEGVVVAKDDLASGAITDEMAIKQCCLNLVGCEE